MDKAEQDKQSAIIKAQGEATSARLIGEAIQQNPAFITLRKIEAARDIAGTISGAANKVFLSSDSLLLNLVSAWRAPTSLRLCTSARFVLQTEVVSGIIPSQLGTLSMRLKPRIKAECWLPCRVTWMS